MKINTMLYNGLNNNDKNRAEIIHCDKYQNCSLYKAGKCLCVSQIFAHTCEFGRVDKIDGYTPRSSSYRSFVDKYMNDECHGKLHRPNNWYIAVVDDTVLLNLIYVIVEKRQWTGYEWKELSSYHVNRAVYTSTISYINKDEFTIDLFERICMFRPIALNGDNISIYNTKIIPNLVNDLKKLMPDFYSQLIDKFPELANLKVDYRDRFAYIYSLRDDVELKTNNGTFIKQVDRLICSDYHSPLLPFGGKTGKLFINITPEMTVKITDNNIVDENTVFI